MVIVGLGNPEPEYSWTRHNLGFRVMDALAAELGVQFRDEADLHGQVVLARCQDHELVLVKPMTGMNDSGLAVAAVLARFDVRPADMLIVYDDVTLPTGTMRFQTGRGAGGAHGIESTIEHLRGELGFHRAKTGVGPDPGGDKRKAYVLAHLPADEHEAWLSLCKAVALALQFWVLNGAQKAMCQFNNKPLV